MSNISANCSIDVSDIDNLTQKFISALHVQLKTSEEELKSLWQEMQTLVLRGESSQMKNSQKESGSKIEKESVLTCQATLKRKNQICGKKVSKNSKTGRYCATHCKCENSTSTVENAPDLSNYHVFKKNAFENYTYGDTGLILKNKDDQKIIGHQSTNGTIRDLTAEEITLCQRRRLDYIANYHANLAENCEGSKVNTVEHTSKLNFL